MKLLSLEWRTNILGGAMIPYISIWVQDLDDDKDTADFHVLPIILMNLDMPLDHWSDPSSLRRTALV